MNLNTLKIFSIGFSGGVVGSLLFLPSIIGYSPDSEIKNPGLVTTSLTPLATNIWEKIASEASLSTVIVQVFKDNRIIKSGNGIILSSDGLVVIPADLTQLGGIYQILYEDKINKGFIVAFDLRRNLAIIKITNPESSLNVSDLNLGLNYQSGQDVLIAGKVADLSKSTHISQRGIISQVNGDRILIDTFTNISLLGAKVLSSSGDLAGMLYLRGSKSYIISSKEIDIFFKEYLSKD